MGFICRFLKLFLARWEAGAYGFFVRLRELSFVAKCGGRRARVAMVRSKARDICFGVVADKKVWRIQRSGVCVVVWGKNWRKACAKPLSVVFRRGF